MCECTDVNLVDVLYHLEKGNRLVPYHKSCGKDLSSEQSKKIDKIQREKWDSLVE